MSEDRTECFKCLSNNQCIPMAEYGSLYCEMLQEYKPQQKKIKYRQKNEIKTLQQFKEELKDTDKDEIIEMFYNSALKLIKIEKILNKDKDDGY